MKIAFLAPYNVDGYELIDDGLGTALSILEDRHVISYLEPDNWNRIKDFNPDVLLHHGALTEDVCKIVAEYPYKKALCFGGGPVTKENIVPYDLYFVESAINEQDFELLGKPWMRAFGINNGLFTPMKFEKKYDACFAGSFSRWKRPELIAPLGKKLVAIGQFQEHEKECYEVCEKSGVSIHKTLERRYVAEFINKSHVVVNPANFWGGGQRLTLESMACDVPVIVCNDSPKNCEYVEESGFGLIVNPDFNSIKEAIENLKSDPMSGGREYVMSKWSSASYAEKLEDGLNNIL